MTEEQITKDRQERVAKCKEELEVILGKYQLGLLAEDMIGQNTKINVQIQFMDLKKHDSPIAQPSNEIIADLLDSKNESLKKKK